MYKIIQTKNRRYFVRDGQSIGHITLKKPYQYDYTVVNVETIAKEEHTVYEVESVDDFQFQNDLAQARVIDQLPTSIIRYSIMPRLIGQHLGTEPFNNEFLVVVHQRSYYDRKKDRIVTCGACEKVLQHYQHNMKQINEKSIKLLFLAYNLLYTIDYTTYFPELLNYVPSLYKYSPEKGKIFMPIGGASIDNIERQINFLI